MMICEIPVAAKSLHNGRTCFARATAFTECPGCAEVARRAAGEGSKKALTEVVERLRTADEPYESTD